MDKHARSYYQPRGPTDGTRGFHEVVELSGDTTWSWDQVRRRCPSMPKGWYELSQLSGRDRLEFIREFWLSHLPYRKQVPEAIENFFRSLDEIALFATQRQEGEPFQAEMVYSVADDGGFFHGYPPITAQGRARFQAQFPDMILPEDYLRFLEVNEGFRKYPDVGILPSDRVLEVYQLLQQDLVSSPLKDTTVDPTDLLPFYRSFDLPCFQCFWRDWYPETEMGNVYYSGLEHTLSSVRTMSAWEDEMAFPTFLDWLAFYLERVE